MWLLWVFFLKKMAKLGFNVKFLLEMGEENGSYGLREFVTAKRHELAADVFIASDGPVMYPRPQPIFLGSEGLSHLR
ncbi:hypothetical protein ACOJBO_01945 [Rhizobium beringeri]